MFPISMGCGIPLGPIHLHIVDDDDDGGGDDDEDDGVVMMVM